MSGRFKPAANTYVRPMDGWWKGNPWFVRYMVREATAVVVVLYALVLLVGLICLVGGPVAYDRWLAVLASPVSVLLHGAALLLLIYHSVTWFKVAPKSTPALPIDPKLITLAGIGFTVVVSLSILGVLWVMS